MWWCSLTDTSTFSIQASSVFIHNSTSCGFISSCVWPLVCVVRVFSITLLVKLGLWSGARLARCHRLDWTEAVCCSDKSTFRPRQWGADSLGCDYHSACLSLSRSLVVSLPPVYCGTVSLFASLRLSHWGFKHMFTTQPVHDFKGGALCSFSELFQSLNTGHNSVIKVVMMWLLVAVCHL